MSRGLLSRKKLLEMTRWMLRQIRVKGGVIRKVHYCLHQSADNCRCKKPQTLLMQKAVKGRRLDRRKLFMVGDSDVDIEAGNRFGCRTVLVLSGRNKQKDVHALAVKPDFVKKNLWEAAKWLTQKKS